MNWVAGEWDETAREVVPVLRGVLEGLSGGFGVARVGSGVWREVVRVGEARAPMAEVGGYNKDRRGVGEVGREKSAVGTLFRGGDGTDEDGDDRNVVATVGRVRAKLMRAKLSKSLLTLRKSCARSCTRENSERAEESAIK